jgi:hypothetical protein
MLRLFFSQRALGRENEDSEFGTEKSKEEEQHKWERKSKR